MAGGGSRRMGGVPKGLELVGGRRIIDRVSDALAQVTSERFLVANDKDAGRWLPGVAILSDVHPGKGGLAGVEAVLARDHDAIVVAWDMPFVTAQLLRALIDAARAHDVDIALPESDSPYGFEPFCAYYSRRIREPLSVFMRAGGGAARDFIHGLERVHIVSTAELQRIGDPARLFFSVNTVEDLERARAIAASDNSQVPQTREDTH